MILSTDSYKLNHWKMYPPGTEAVYSYFESREGAQFPYTVFFGLQYILEKYLTRFGGWYDLKDAHDLAAEHFGRDDYFNEEGWRHIALDHNGKLPLHIRAVPEGTCVPVSTPILTIENTCPKCFWLTNYVESLLTHVWYPSTVATQSHAIKQMMRDYLERTATNLDALDFMLHDFGYRGASTEEAARIGGAAHLVNFKGTDTVPALDFLRRHYGATGVAGYSVAASEHSVMTSLGEEGEFQMVDHLLAQYPTGILSVVADSYDIYRFVDKLRTLYCDQIMARDGVFVVRPDSVTSTHNPAELTVWILERLAAGFGVTINSKGFEVLHPTVRVLWGDGIDMQGVGEILGFAAANGYSSENLVFGMGGGLLQKVNRDTQRFAFKCSAQKRNGVWHDVWKSPIDTSKASKRGRFDDDRLETVFLDGVVTRTQTLDQIRSLAERGVSLV